MTFQTKADEGFIRPLTAQEEIFWTVGFSEPVNAVVAADLEGATIAQNWQYAIDAVHRRHPMLRVGIEKRGSFETGGRPWFRANGQRSIPLTFRPLREISWENVVEDEVVRPFAWGEAPLIRAVVLYSDCHCVLVLAACHAITDGQSLAFILRDLVDVLNGGEVKPLPWPDSAEDRLDLDPDVRLPMTAERAVTNDVVRQTGRPVVEARCLSAPLTQSILGMARQRGCTLHGALVAASAMALHERASEFKTKPVGTMSPISTRRVLEAGDSCGMYFICRSVIFPPDDQTPFWEQARRVRSELAPFMDRSAAEADAAGERSVVAAGITVPEAVDLVDHGLAFDIMVTNIGRMPDSARSQPVKIRCVSLAVVHCMSARQTIAACTTNGELCLTATSREPVDGLLDRVAEILKAASVWLGDVPRS